MKVQLSVWEKDDFGNIGYTPEGSTERLYCCSPELKEEGVCQEEFTLIVNDNVKHSFYIHDVDFVPTDVDGKQVTCK